MREALWIAVLTLFGPVAGDARAEPRAVISDAPEIPTLERLATLTLDDDPEKPKILHRLADAYDQRARELARLVADESNESRHLQLERKQQAFERLSMNAWAVLADDPKWSHYPRRDEALFRAAEQLDHELLAVADAEQRHAGLVDRGRRERSVLVVHRGRAA